MVFNSIQNKIRSRFYGQKVIYLLSPLLVSWALPLAHSLHLFFLGQPAFSLLPVSVFFPSLGTLFSPFLLPKSSLYRCDNPPCFIQVSCQISPSCNFWLNSLFKIQTVQLLLGLHSFSCLVVVCV